MLPLAEFHLSMSKSGRYLFSSACKPCHNARGKASRRRGMKGMTYLQAKRREHFERRVRARGFVGSFEEWVSDMCPLRKECARLEAQQWAPVSIIRLQETAAEVWRRRYRTDPEFNLRERMKTAMRKHRRFGCLNTRLREGIKGAKAPRVVDLYALLGYSVGELRQHLEKQFTRGMNWQRFMKGEIHIDHVRPVSSFDMNSEEDVRQGWALPNLQPMWAKENLQKGASRVAWLV
jgi:hypothetical protein